MDRTAPLTAEDLDVVLRSHGLRVTAQRRHVLQAIEELRHATAEQVCLRAQRDNPELNLSTVYRTLELFEELGLVSHAHLEHGAPTYHAVSGKPHLHLVCRDCTRIIVATADAARELTDRLARDYGFHTDVRHLAVHGLCADCADRRQASSEGKQPDG